METNNIYEIALRNDPIRERVTTFGWNPNTANLGLGFWREFRPRLRVARQGCVYVCEREVERERERETRRLSFFSRGQRQCVGVSLFI